MRILSALIFILSINLAESAAAPYALELLLPADATKVLGEKFSVELKLKLEKSYRLDEASIPSSGRVGLQLQRSQPELHKPWLWFQRDYRLRIPYQVISQSAEPSFVVVPALVLSLTADGKSYPLVVEPFSVSIAGGVTLAERKLGDPLDLWAARYPPVLDARLWNTGFLVSLAALLVIAFWLLWQKLLAPLWEKYQRPFARANRALAKLPASVDERSKLQIVHRALDDSAQETVLSCDLENFLQRYPHFAPVGTGIEHFFTVSDRLFYCTDSRVGQSMDIGELLSQCALIEQEQ